MIVSLWRRWVHALMAPETGESLALFRIAVGAVVCLTVWDPVWDGVVEMMWVDRAYGGYRLLGDGPWLVALLGGPSPGVVYGLIGVVTGLALALMAGIGGPIGARVLAFSTLHGCMALTDLNGHAAGSFDELISNALWLLTLAGSHPTLSVHCRRTTGRWVSDTPVAFWPRLLIVAQLFLMYWTTGLQKVSTHWVPGGDLLALYYILQQPTWQWADMSWVAPYAWATKVGTAMSWWWEVTTPLWLVAWWTSRTAGAEQGPGLRARLVRWRLPLAYAVVGVGFHVGIVLTLNVGPFTHASLAYYAALVHPRVWRRVLRLSHLSGRAAAPGPLPNKTPAPVPASR